MRTSGRCVSTSGRCPRLRRYSRAARANDLLLKELKGVPEEKRTARYVAVAAFARPDGRLSPLFRGVCVGRIPAAPRGSRGFGYDPIFFYPPFGTTFGETDDAQKDRVSHRGLALTQVAEFLRSTEGRAFLET